MAAAMIVCWLSINQQMVSLSVLYRYWLILRTLRSSSYEHSPRRMEEFINTKFNEVNHGNTTFTKDYQSFY